MVVLSGFWRCDLAILCLMRVAWNLSALAVCWCRVCAGVTVALQMFGLLIIFFFFFDGCGLTSVELLDCSRMEKEDSDYVGLGLFVWFCDG
jgi:hypothetical protein